MRIPFWTAWQERERARWLAMEREGDDWLDAQVDEWQRHQLNEDIGFPGDPPWYDNCPAVGDGHLHWVPRSLLPERLVPTEEP